MQVNGLKGGHRVSALQFGMCGVGVVGGEGFSSLATFRDLGHFEPTGANQRDCVLVSVAWGVPALARPCSSSELGFQLLKSLLRNRR